MSRTLSSFIAVVSIAAASLLTACSSKSPTAPQAANPNAGKHEITVSMTIFFIVGACEGVSSNPGEFYYSLRVMKPLQGPGFETLWVTQGRLTGLPTGANRPADYEFKFIMDPQYVPNTFTVESRCTEYDNGVPDPRMNEYGSSRLHAFTGGTDWNNGAHSFHIGDGSCGYEIHYSVSVRVL